MTHIRIDRPRMPEGYGVPETDAGLLVWEQVRERLEAAKNYWVCTTGPDLVPHARPLWGAWRGERFYFDGAITTRWGRNLVANPQVQINLESGSEVVIVEGRFTQQNDLDAATFAEVQASYWARYENYKPETREQLYMVVPHKILAWTSFPTDLTRFRFS